MPFVRFQAHARHVALVALALPLALPAQQPLETETARLPRRGATVLSGTYEFQTSRDGKERAVPFAIEYGLLNRLALLVEPVFYTSIRPSTGRSATGLGDLEATLQYLLRAETSHVPALAVGAEAKLPTANDPLIGTRRADFTPYLIASKQFGRLDVHANVGWSFMGKPPGVAVQNTLNLAFALEHHVSERFHLLGEVLSTSAASALGGGENNPASPEVTGAEQIVMVGLRFAFRPRAWLSIGVTYDNNGAVLFRPGLTLELP